MIVPASEALSAREFRLVSDLVYRHCGINLHDGKQVLASARLAKCIRTAGFDSAAEYLAYIQKDSTGREFAKMIDALSTNLTSFFREKQHFDYLKEKFLPALISRKSRVGGQIRKLRAWSAGCSTGEEAYSLAITMREVTGAASHWNTRLLATDISRPVLEKARAGIYEQSRVAAMPPALLRRYFKEITHEGRAAVEVGDAIRGIVQFNYLNLMGTWPFSGPFDFIFCRNVMIYFDKPTQERLVNRFWQCLHPGGLLFTGHSESLTGMAHQFRHSIPTVYEKSCD